MNKSSHFQEFTNDIYFIFLTDSQTVFSYLRIHERKQPVPNYTNAAAGGLLNGVGWMIELWQ